MMACTSPAFTSRLRPLRIALPLTLARRFRISSINRLFPPTAVLADASFQADPQKLLGLHGELHRELTEDLLAESIDDQRYGVLGRQAALPAVKDLIFTDLGCRCLWLGSDQGRTH